MKDRYEEIIATKEFVWTNKLTESENLTKQLAEDLEASQNIVEMKTDHLDKAEAALENLENKVAQNEDIANSREIEVKNIKRYYAQRFGKLFSEFFSCPICSELFVEPVNLGCGHVYCKVCASSWEQTQGRKSCPLCQQDYTDTSRSLLISGFLEKGMEEVRQLEKDINRDTLEENEIGYKKSSGVIKRMKRYKGCGFITEDDGGQEIVFHYKDLEFGYPFIGEKVEFRKEENSTLQYLLHRHKYRAVRVKPLEMFAAPH